MASKLETISEIENLAKPLDLMHEVQFKTQLNNILAPGGLKLIFKPKYKNPALDRVDFNLNKYKTKRSFFSKLLTPLTILGMLLILLVVTWAVHAPWISQYTRNQLIGVDMSAPAFSAPSALHPLGTANFGQDVLGRLIYGARSSITLGLSTIAISSILGCTLGIYSAYQGGVIDGIIMRFADVVMAFPSLILTIIILGIFQAQLDTDPVKIILLTWGFLGIPGYARFMRGTVLGEKEKTYVESAKVSGASDFKIMFRHILPNSITPIIISVTFDLGGMILGLAGLAFLGWGARGIEWGMDISDNKAKLQVAPWCAIWPGVGILLTVLGFMLFGDGLRDALDPRSKK